jgi:hypothetical protein
MERVSHANGSDTLKASKYRITIAKVGLSSARYTFNPVGVVGPCA